MTFTRTDTKIIKGIAVVLMLAHHMFLFSERLPIGFSYNCSIMIQDKTLLRVMGEFGRICVSLFMFLGGYGLWCRREQAGLLKENIIRLYRSYWKVFFLFVPIGFLFFGNQPVYCEDASICQVFSDFHFERFLANLLGWEATYNKEWWFFKSYLRTMILGYLYMRYVKPVGFWLECFFVILITIFTQDIFPGLAGFECFERLGRDFWYQNLFTYGYTSCCFFMGIVFARYNGIQKLRELLSAFRLWVRKAIAIIGIIAIVYSWYFIIDEDMAILYVPCFIVLSLELLDRIVIVQKAFDVLGKHSTNIWLIHSFLCYYFYLGVRITYISANPWIDLLVLLILSLGISCGIEWIYKWIGNGLRPILYRGE